MGIDGLRVLDLAGLPGVYGTKLLADLGADVVRIEPITGDALREMGPFFRDRPGPGRSLPFAFYNTSKRSLALDFESESGRDLFRSLAGQADVVFESEAPGALDERGIGPNRLQAEYPGLIWVAITPFGQAGPRAGWRGNDLIAMAAGGVLYLNGLTDRPPINAPLHQAYHLGGSAGASGALVALRQRLATGRGQLVDVSLQAAAATGTENTLGFWDYEGVVRRRQGRIAFNGTTILHRCSDGWAAGMAGNRWALLLSWAEKAGVADERWRDPAFLDREMREARMDEANGFVEILFAQQSVDQVVSQARDARLPIQPVNRIPDLFSDPQPAFRGFWTPVAHDDLGATITYPGAPFLSSSGFWQIRHRAPLPGEHSRAILKEAGYDEGRIEALIAAGVVGEWNGTRVKGERRKAKGEGRRAKGEGSAAATLFTAGERELTAQPVAPTQNSERRTQNSVQPSTFNLQPSTNNPPLHGIRVLDFSQAVTGPLAARILADHGAEVIKIEWGRRPDPMRAFAPRLPKVSPNVGALFNQVNASKRSLTLNLNSDGGRALLRQLIGITDIVLDNYGHDPFPKWGITFDQVRAIRPDIIMVRSSTTGRNGPRAGLAGLGFGIAAAAGWNALMGYPGDPPVGMGPAFPDYAVNLHHLLAAVLVSLEHRRTTGEGQYVDLSQHESTITWVGPAILDYTANGRASEPNGNRHPDFAPHGVYPTAGKDRWIAIAVNERGWPAFQRLAALDPVRFGSHHDRKMNEDELDRLVSEWTADQEAGPLTERLQDEGIAAYPLLDGPGLVTDPQLAARGHYVALDHPEAGHRLWDRHAFQLSDSPATPRRTALLGEDNDWALGELLGLDEESIATAIVEAHVE